VLTERLERDDIVKGEGTQYIIDVANNSFMPAASVRVRFKAGSPAVVTDLVDQFISIRAFKSEQTVFNVSSKYRGAFDIGVQDIVLYDFLGLFKFKQAHDKTLTLIVRPQVASCAELPLKLSQVGAEDSRDMNFEEDYSVISDLRKYQPTDGYKKIHWKMTARKNELISKNFQGTKRNTVAFILDNSAIIDIGYHISKSESALMMEDALVECLVAAVAQSVWRRNLCALYFLGGGMQEYSGDFEYLYQAASAIKFGEYQAADFDGYLDTFAKMQVDAENVVIVVKEITGAVSGAAQTLKLFGNNVIVLYFKKAKWKHEEGVAELREMGIHCINATLGEQVHT